MEKVTNTVLIKINNYYILQYSNTSLSDFYHQTGCPNKYFQEITVTHSS